VGRGLPTRIPWAINDAQRLATIHWKYAARKPCFQIILEPLLKLDAALALGKQLDSFLNFGQSNDAYMLRFSIRRLKPALDAYIGAARPIVLGKNIRVDQETARAKSIGRG
jgi:hypothetical protein